MSRRPASPQEQARWLQKQQFAAEMRDNPTPAEARLLRELATRKYGEWQSQVVICGWIIDFYCAECKLAVEVDGGYHVDRQTEDEFRDATLLKNKGIRTLRLPNELVLGHTELAIEKVVRSIEATPGVRPRRARPPRVAKKPKVVWRQNSEFSDRLKVLSGQLPYRD